MHQLLEQLPLDVKPRQHGRRPPLPNAPASIHSSSLLRRREIASNAVTGLKNGRGRAMFAAHAKFICASAHAFVPIMQAYRHELFINIIVVVQSLCVRPLESIERTEARKLASRPRRVNKGLSSDEVDQAFEQEEAEVDNGAQNCNILRLGRTSKSGDRSRGTGNNAGRVIMRASRAESLGW